MRHPALATLIAVAVVCAVLIVRAEPDAPRAGVPIRVDNAQVNPVDLSVTYDYVNTAVDVTAYEISITRHFADGTTLVSASGQDWFSSSGYSEVRVGGFSHHAVWLVGRPGATPGPHLHQLSSPPPTKAALIDAEVTLTAVIRRDGSTFGDASVLARLFARRVAMLAEYAYWVPRLRSAGAAEDPAAAFSWAVEALAAPRRGEFLSGPRESLLDAATVYKRYSEAHPGEGSRIFEAIITGAAHQYELLLEQSVRMR